MSAADDLSGMGGVARLGPVDAAYVQAVVEAVIDATSERATAEERKDFLAYLDRRIANAAAVERSTAPDAETREIAGDRRRQMEVIRDEIAQGMHVGQAALLAQLGESQ